MAGFSKEHLTSFDSSAVAGFDKDQMGNFNPEAMAGFSKEHLANFDSSAVAGFDKEHLANFDSSAVSGLARDHIREMDEGALVGFKEEHVRNLNDDSKKGMGDKVSTFEEFAIGVRKALVDKEARRLGGVGSFKDLVDSVAGALDKQQLLGLGWDEFQQADSLEFGSQEALGKSGIEEVFDDRAKSAFSRLTLVAD